MPFLLGTFSLKNVALWPRFGSDLRHSPWPYIDNLENDQESSGVVGAGYPPKIGSCGHDNCGECIQWISYPQSHSQSWTLKRVTKSGIARVVRDLVAPTSIYTIDVFEDGVFRNSATALVTSKNKQEYWRHMLSSDSEVSAYPRIVVQPCPIELSA